VAKARSEGRPILVNFTADWCVTCQANNKNSLEISSVRQRLKTIQAATFLADYTRANDLIANELKKFGRESVPLVLVYPHEPSAEPLVLPALLTPQIVLEALQYAVLPEEELITPALRPLVEAARQGNPKAPRRSGFGGFGGNGFGEGGFGGNGAKLLESKLETIRLDEVQYDALPLSVVVEQLVQESRQRDPAKRGVNFLFGHSTEPAPPRIDPATGLPDPRSVEAVDVPGVTVRIMPALRNVRLIDVLNAITRVANPPVQYSITDYAVVFSAAPSAGASTPPATAASSTSSPLVIKTFTINTDTIAAAAQRSLGVKLVLASNEEFIGGFRTILGILGVKIDGPNKALFYNDLTRILMVRATTDDLLVVEALLEMLGSGTDRPSRTSATPPKTAAGAEEAGAKLIRP
jgi:hypothetical protein